MTHSIVLHLEDDVITRLKRRAARHGRSMEEEVRHILRNAVMTENACVSKLGSRIAARFRKSGLRAELPELHGEHFQDLKVPVVNPWEGQDRD